MVSVKGSSSRMYLEAWGVLDGSGLDVAPAFGSSSTCFVVAVTSSFRNLLPSSARKPGKG